MNRTERKALEAKIEVLVEKHLRELAAKVGGEVEALKDMTDEEIDAALGRRAKN
jgi:hypothetical protein